MYVTSVNIDSITTNMNILMFYIIYIITLLKFKSFLGIFSSLPAGSEASGPQLLPVRALNEVFIGESLSSRYV